MENLTEEKKNERFYSPPSTPIQPVMDRGFRACLVCFASFWINGTVFGIINTSGTLFEKLTEKYENKNNVATTFVGSVCIGTTFFLSVVAGILTDRFGIQRVALVGAIIATCGMLLSSFVESVELYVLTYGLIFGTGASLTYTPSLVILGHYFQKYLGLVNGIVTFGSSAFTIVLPFLLKELFATIGIQHTLQFKAVLISTLILCSLCLRPQLMPKAPPEKSLQQCHRSWRDKCIQFCSKLINLNIWRNQRYRIWAMTIPLALFGYFVPYMHINKYVSEVYKDENGAILLMCIGVTSGLGRIIFGLVADFPRINRIYLQQLSFLSIGLLTIVIPFAKHFEVLIVICLGLGVFDGCFISLLGPIAIDLTGRQGATQAIGNLLALCSIPLTLGPPIATWIRDSSGSYNPAFWYAGVPPILGALAMFLVHRASAVPLEERPPSALAIEYAAVPTETKPLTAEIAIPVESKSEMHKDKRPDVIESLHQETTNATVENAPQHIEHLTAV